VISAMKRWSIEIVMLTLFLVMVFAWFRSMREARESSERLAAVEMERDKALQEAAAGRVAVARADTLQTRLDDERMVRECLEARNRQLEGDLAGRPYPPKPGPVPSSYDQQLADMREMGTQPEALPPARLAFPNADAPTLWTWGKEAARVPALESRLEVEGQLVGSLQDTIGATKAELATTGAQRDGYKEGAQRFEAAFTGASKAVDILKIEVGEVTRQRDRARSTRIYVGLGALAIGGYFGYRLGHH
jgi:hypothetical protein